MGITVDDQSLPIAPKVIGQDDFPTYVGEFYSNSREDTAYSGLKKGTLPEEAGRLACWENIVNCVGVVVRSAKGMPRNGV